MTRARDHRPWGRGPERGYAPPVRTLTAGLVAGILTLPLASPAEAVDVTWTRVGTGITQGVSGLAPHAAGGWVVVRDNKTAGQNRVALLSDAGTVTPLTWPGTAPQDIEAVSAVPGSTGRYAVVTSGGAGRIIAVNGSALTVVRSFTLPSGKVENEGFSLVRISTTTVAVWGNRGSTSTPGRLYAATFNTSTGAFGRVVNGTVSVPYPTTGVRHISDVAVVGSRLVVSSASDNGNNGPFDSALYDVGTVSLASGRARLTLVTPQSLGTYDDHKIEGIACKGTTGLLGTDDENLGGFVAPGAFCG